MSVSSAHFYFTFMMPNHNNKSFQCNLNEETQQFQQFILRKYLAAVGRKTLPFDKKKPRAGPDRLHK